MSVEVINDVIAFACAEFMQVRSVYIRINVDYQRGANDEPCPGMVDASATVCGDIRNATKAMNFTIQTDHPVLPDQRCSWVVVGGDPSRIELDALKA